MVRPRTGDFCYSEEEFGVILEDIRLFKQEAVDGVVIGMLNADGTVDEVKVRR